MIAPPHCIDGFVKSWEDKLNTSPSLFASLTEDVEIVCYAYCQNKYPNFKGRKLETLNGL